MNINQLLYEKGRQDALAFQAESSGMTGTELYSEEELIPDFEEAIKVKNMIERHAGLTDGFLCKSSEGRIVRLLQNYDSNVFPGEPETLPAQWGFKWSTNPADAKPFIALSTSPYNTNECCSENGIIYRSKQDNNVWAPSAYPPAWEVVE